MTTLHDNFFSLFPKPFYAFSKSYSNDKILQNFPLYKYTILLSHGGPFQCPSRAR